TALRRRRGRVPIAKCAPALPPAPTCWSKTPGANSILKRRSAAPRLQECLRFTDLPTRSMRSRASFVRTAPRQSQLRSLATYFRAIIHFSQNWKPRCRQSYSQTGVIDWLVAVELALDLRQRVFQAARTIEQHDLVAARHAAIRKALFVRGISGRALRTQQESLLARHFVQRRADRIVRHRDRKSAAFAHCAQNEKVADRLRHADSGRDRMRIFP